MVHLQFFSAICCCEIKKPIDEIVKEMNSYSEEWISCFDPNTNNPYYYNTITGISQWEEPPNFPTTNITTTTTTTAATASQHLFNGPGGIRPQNSTEDSIPTILKVKSKSGLTIGSFRSHNNKILPIAHEATEDSPQSENDHDPSLVTLKKDLSFQKKARPTVKLKGTPLLNLKRALSNQQLEIDTGNQEQSSSSITTNSQNINHHSSQLPSLTNAPTTTTSQPSTNQSRDYLRMAQTYKRYIPYTERFFDSNTICILCHLATPIDIIFPCNHRCICRNCLSLSPYVQLSTIPSDSPAAPLDPSNQLSPEAKQKKVGCPLCNVLIKQIIPINGKGTEESEYWDWILETNNGPGGMILDQQFVQLFSENIPTILEHSYNHQDHDHHQDHHQVHDKQVGEQNRQQRYQQLENGNIDTLNPSSDGQSPQLNESDKSSENAEKFPQFSPYEEGSRGCCIIQ